MYYPFFLAYILTGILIGGTVFIWALKNGQFTQQQRARFLALEDVQAGTEAASDKAKLELYCIFYLALLAIVASVALVGYALFIN